MRVPRGALCRCVYISHVYHMYLWGGVVSGTTRQTIVLCSVDGVKTVNDSYNV